MASVRSPQAGVRTGRTRRWVGPAVLVFLVLAAGGYFGGRYWWYASRFAAAREAERRRDLTTARADLDRCLRFWPDDPEVHLLAARVGWRSALARPFEPGWDQPARAHLAEADRSPALADRVDLERSLLAAVTGNLRLVEARLIDAVMDDHPESTAILEALTRANLDSHQPANAARCATLLIGRAPDQPLGYFWRGMAFDLVYRPDDKVEQDFRKAVRLDPDNPDFRQQLALRLLNRKSDLPEARVEFERLADERPDDPAVLVGLATCRIELGDGEAARPLLGRVLARDPNNWAAHAGLGRVELAADRPAEAERWLLRAVELAPYSHEANARLADALVLQHKVEEATRYRDRADQIRVDLDRIKPLATAVAKQPGSPALRTELGVLLLRTGFGDVGRNWVLSALAVDPGYEPARRALAEARRAGVTPP